MAAAETKLANLTAVPLEIIPTTNFTMGIYMLIIGELHQQ